MNSYFEILSYKGVNKLTIDIENLFANINKQISIEIIQYTNACLFTSNSSPNKRNASKHKCSNL